MGGALQTHTSCFWRLHLTDDALLSLEITFSHRELMSTSLQGASGPSGHAGLRPAFGQPAVSGNDTAPEPVLTKLQQMLQERSISDQLKTLIVRPLTGVFDVSANDPHGGTSNPSKSYGRRTLRYDPARPTKYPPDQSEGFVCDERKARRFGEQL